MPTPTCSQCKMPMAMKESIDIGVCMACRPWFVGVDMAKDEDRTSVKCWCGAVASWTASERRPSGCKRCGARFDFKSGN